MILPWDKELSSYDTVDKLATLASAMELDPLYITRAVRQMRMLQVEKPFPDPLSDKELDDLEIDFLRMAIYEEILVRREKRKLEKLIHGENSNIKSYFVTIGLDDKQFKEDNEAMIINPMMKKLIDTPGFDNMKYVIEKYRKNEEGIIYEHRHIHMVFDSNLRKSKIIQYCFQKTKRYVQGVNFIDVKLDPGRARERYINGQKAESKIECVEKDRTWRQEKKIMEQR